MPEPSMSEPGVSRAGTVLAFDFGLRRIGVALGETLLGQARALTVIDNERNDVRFATIATLIRDWQPCLLIVGLPCATDGTAHTMTARCQRFAEQLRQRFQLPVQHIDERYSSTEADARLANTGLDWRSRKQQVDAVAAQIILQDYFDHHFTLTPSTTTS
ncbi:MAG: Holliday junction resolvase RuvX [Sterolibacterium sp.]|nr:Holliday junction resolvase RuvX [Sterolibacterium sp.]MBP9799812.1 Holliday junction resolvase RuvX [Sterolibacterium sp.]